MTLNLFVQAAAKKLSQLWPDRAVRVDKIPQNADGSFFLGLAESSQDRELDRRFRRSLGFQVLYFLKSEDVLAYQEWAEAMYDHFRGLVVQDGEKNRLVRLKNCSAREDSTQRYYQFLFDVDLVLLDAPEPGTLMGAMTQKETIKQW